MRRKFFFTSCRKEDNGDRRCEVRGGQPIQFWIANHEISRVRVVLRSKGSFLFDCRMRLSESPVLFQLDTERHASGKEILR